AQASTLRLVIDPLQGGIFTPKGNAGFRMHGQNLLFGLQKRGSGDKFPHGDDWPIPGFRRREDYITERPQRFLIAPLKAMLKNSAYQKRDRFGPKTQTWRKMCEIFVSSPEGIFSLS
ncbi:MAG: hypothetical protein J6J41_00665, partial [Clostridia bacterium]|nr:hypothetical protein [Clostridia bacterium]